MKRFVSLCLLLASVLALHAQSFTLKGRIVDTTEYPYIGVSVTIKGTTIGTVSDLNGNFSLDIPDLKTNNIVVFSYIGCKTQEYKVDGKTNNITIVLQEDSHTLDETVVMGHAISKKKTITGSVAKISADKFAEMSASVAMESSSSDYFIGDGIADYREYHDSDFSGINSGTLTAGELSDFAKWDQWENILTKDFKTYLNKWKYRPLDRYMAQLTNRQGMPVVNAEVSLQNEFGTVLWKTRTDNTGKAELWADLFTLEKETSTENLKLVFDYDGKKTELTRIIPFTQGINTTKIDADCNIRNGIDIFFVVDATGSMGDEIRYLQVELNDIIKRVKEQQSDFQLRMGSLVYRDKGDEYLVRKSSLDADIDNTINFLKGQRADGGGDYPEAVDEAMYEAIANENWNDDALARIAFLVLDAPAHDDATSIARIAEQTRLAAEKGIRLVPIVCSGMQKDGEYLMRCLALATNGTYIFLTDDSGVGGSHIKPTTDKWDVEKLNDAIVRVIKQYTQMPDCKNSKWDKALKKEEASDKHVPNPYDESPEEDVSALTSSDIMKVYPNPCSNVLKVEFKKEAQDLYFVDMAGKSLLRMKPKEGEIIEADIRHLSSGVYFVKAYYKGKWFAEKVIIKAS
ncbi:carboxypeptidase-like regulatory domain-containing protein [Dysgonomonas sp. 520]|uniref:carboxypeptidase-like regulatory domain-containing protein n=1 Tax=Dysgonomonas sp. 520 TaxID=2302931 RepID=UPI0013D4C169|nr:carboxypeptidase-like regulatory domain-containing protein [Dysgonomonas sp. 520]NDW08188.1 T9SS C-terminal target domain-containing protein [Dysgonomonas sp. 520]